MTYPSGFDANWSEIISTPREMVMNVPVMNGKIFEIFRDEVVFDFIVENEALKIVEIG